jgi:hypothetical protein
MRILATCVVAVLLIGMIGAAAVAKSKVAVHAQAWWDRTVRGIEESMPDAQLEEVAQIKIKGYDEKVGALHVTVGRLADRLAAGKVEVEEMERQLAAEKRLLTRAKNMLEGETTRTRFEVGGRMVTRDQLAADAESRLNRCMQLDATMMAKRKLVEQLALAHSDGQANVVKAKQLKQGLMGELDAVKARLAVANSQREMMDIVAALRDAPLGPDSDVARALGMLKDRAAALERMGEYRGEANRPTIAWDREEQLQVTEKIARFLEK